MPMTPGGMPAEAWPALRVAVNDDSVGSWFVDAASEFCIERQVLLDIVIDDQDHTAQRIRDGSVQGAVTTQAEPVQGCRSTRLGTMRYVAVCAPAFFAQYFGNGVNRESWRQAPCVVFNAKDALQTRFMRRVTRAAVDPPVHWVPHVGGFVRACVMGLGWGMCPTRMIAAQLATGELVEILPGRRLDVDLYWQSWRLSVGLLDEFGVALRKRAADFLD
jgi:LysR family transcriptional regulator (chromosome initiation inhibitor)